jgi:FtsZ-binding cell division protein ZapB
MSLEISMQEVEQLKAENAELRTKYELLIVHCERLVDENEQLKVYKEHLTEEMDRITGHSRARNLTPSL